MRTDILVNDTPLTRYGFTLIPDLEGWRDMATGGRPTDQVPGLAGRIMLDPRPDVAPRQLVVQGYLRATSVSALLESHRQLKALLSGARLEVRFADDLTKVLACVLPEGRFPGLPPRLISREAKCTLRFEALDPYWYDRDPVIVAEPATKRIRCLVGTAPVAPTLQIQGAAASPVVTPRNHAGDPLPSLTWTGSLLGTDYLKIDCAARTATKYTSGVPSDVTSGLSGTFPILSAEDGSYELGGWPSLEVSTGTSLTVNYKRGWL